MPPRPTRPMTTKRSMLCPRSTDAGEAGGCCPGSCSSPGGATLEVRSRLREPGVDVLDGPGGSLDRRVVGARLARQGEGAGVRRGAHPQRAREREARLAAVLGVGLLAEPRPERLFERRDR